MDPAAQRVERRDRVRVTLDASTTVRHANGWVDAWGIATRSGVLQYPEHGTSEFRPAEEVFDAASLATLRGAPLTLDHPDGLVSSANARDLTHGWVLQVAPAAPAVRVQVRVATDAALAELDRGVLELSCGYEADYEAGEGIDPDGVPYTGTQRRIRYNHLALVQLARAGHAARLTLDSSRGPHMRPIKIRSITRQLPAYLADAIAAQAPAAAERVRLDAAIEVETVTIGGVDLVLPKEMVAAIMAALGIGGGAAPTAPADEAPASLEEKPPGAPPAGPPRMDAEAIRAIVRQALEDDRADRVRADALERRSTEILGRAATPGDPWAVMVECVSRLDDGRAAEAEQLAARARRGDIRAAGQLEGLMDGLPRLPDDSSAGLRSDRTTEAAKAIDSARRDSAPAKASADPLAEAREKSRQRKLAAGKPAA